MNKTDYKILLLENTSACIGFERDFLLNQYVTVVESKPSVDICALCLNHDIDLVISASPDYELKDYFSSNDLFHAIPVGCLVEEHNLNELPDFLHPIPLPTSQDQLAGIIKPLLKIRSLYRSIESQQAEIEQLQNKLDQHQVSMKQHREFLNVLASRDGLTGLFNRRHFNKVLLEEFQQCIQTDTDLSLLIFDIDYFYELNKAVGNSFGDFVLNDFAARLTTAVQPEGTCFRFSGEIFTVILPNKNHTEATILGESICRQLKDKPFARGKDTRNVTISGGLVSLQAHQPTDPDEFVTMAERALFRAKSEGRDRLVSYHTEAMHKSAATAPDVTFLKETLSRILDKTRSSAIDSLQLLAKDLAGDKNRSHIENVRNYVELLGQYMRLPEPIIQTFKNAITLHTSIRFLLHNELINKNEPFSLDDRKIMDDFPYKLAEIADLFDYFSNERTILLHHGERYDGSGYPEGLQGEEIPLGARIFNIMDALAAMSSDRPHRRKLEPPEIIDELTQGAGTQFDPRLVIQTLELIRSHGLFAIENHSIDQAIATIKNSLTGTST